MTRPREKMLVRNHRPAKWILLLVLAGVLQFAGCAVGPKYKTPVAPAPPAYKEMGNWKTAQPSDQSLGGNWWSFFRTRSSTL